MSRIVVLVPTELFGETDMATVEGLAESVVFPPPPPPAV
jgi:hypothetical protein